MLFIIILKFISLFSTIFADSVEFGLLALVSGSVLQYSSVGPNTDGLLAIGSGTSSTGKITKDGYLILDNKMYVSVNRDMQYNVVDDKLFAKSGFSIKKGHLLFTDPFIAHQQGKYWILYTKRQNSNLDLHINIAAITSDGTFAPDYPPK